MSIILQSFRDEMRRVIAFRPAFSVLVLAAVIYAGFYPQPYVNEALRDIPIAVVDRDGTTASRDLARRIDATPDVAVAQALPDLVTAEREIYARNAYGIVYIPENFERDLLHGRASPIALYADASYFLIYQRVAGGVSAVARTFGTEVEQQRLAGIGVDPNIAAAAADPMRLTTVALFNPQGGYATYLLPAAFVLIVQQTLLIGVGLLGASSGAARRNDPSLSAAGGAVAGKLLAYLALEAVIVPAYLVLLPYLYGVPRLGSVVMIMIFAVPFVLSVSGLGLMIASIFRTPQSVQLTLAAIGLPFFFLAGFAWPAEAIPGGLRLVSLLVPSTSAIEGFVKIAQLGATLAQARNEFLTLWALAIVYCGIAVMLEAAKHRGAAVRAAI